MMRNSSPLKVACRSSRRRVRSSNSRAMAGTSSWSSSATWRSAVVGSGLRLISPRRSSRASSAVTDAGASVVARAISPGGVVRTARAGQASWSPPRSSRANPAWGEGRAHLERRPPGRRASSSRPPGDRPPVASPSGGRPHAGPAQHRHGTRVRDGGSQPPPVAVTGCGEDSVQYMPADLARSVPRSPVVRQDRQSAAGSWTSSR